MNTFLCKIDIINFKNQYQSSVLYSIQLIILVLYYVLKYIDEYLYL